MKLPYLFFCVLLFCGLSSCGDSGNASIGSDLPSSTTAPAPAKDKPQPAEAATATPAKTQHDCELTGKALEDGAFWLPERERLFVIIADTAQMYDKDYPESYRSFQIYDTKICDLIGNHVMPVNKEPDYPYYLYPNTLEEVNQVICAQGSDFVYCYDLARREMLLPMIPKYLSKRRATDAGSGLPQGLTVWDHYLFGNAAEYGTYGFDLRDKKQVKDFLPVAEYKQRESGAMNQLFMAEINPGEFQAAYASFDFDAGENAFQIKPLFKTPLPISPRLSQSARNNNLLVFKYKDKSSAIGVNMEKGERVDLPSEVATKPVQEILAWMKKQ